MTFYLGVLVVISYPLRIPESPKNEGFIIPSASSLSLDLKYTFSISGGLVKITIN